MRDTEWPATVLNIASCYATMSPVKVRIGFGLGARTSVNGADFLALVDDLERLQFDSLWMSERIASHAPDPVVAMSMAAARTSRLKVGMSVMVLPGRNPVVLAKELATLDVMSGGRLLPAFGLGAADAREHNSFAVTRETRAAIFNEALQVMRACWTQESVTFHGQHFSFDDVSVLPKPIQNPPDVWLAGIADSELRRVGRLADGWLPSFITPPEAAVGWHKINDEAARNDRTIDPEHFGVLIPYSLDAIPEQVISTVASRRSSEVDPNDIIPVGWQRLVELIHKFIAIGASKFVVIPMGAHADVDWTAHLEEAASILKPLEN
ncbi:MAG: TIGR03619 family F420-dependent LLM class oxidoreductase [Actinobacteria bacterium]|nr:TIGR03619 family F420-dependent LLM class oxidoreductase [Actinomycetota bacterium]